MCVHVVHMHDGVLMALFDDFHENGSNNICSFAFNMFSLTAVPSLKIKTLEKL